MTSVVSVRFSSFVPGTKRVFATNVQVVGSYPNFYNEIIDKTAPVSFYIVAAYYQSGSSGGAGLQATGDFDAYDPVDYSFFLNRSIVSPPDWVSFGQVTDPLAYDPNTVVQYFADNGFSPVVVSNIPQTQLSNQGFRFTVGLLSTHDSGQGMSFLLRHPPDDIPPTVTITPPTGIVTVGGVNYTKNNPSTVAISAADSHADASGLKHITPTVDGTPSSPVASSSTNVSVAGEGSHTVSATAEDNNGNVSTPVSYTFFIDSVAPSVTLALSSTQDLFVVNSLDYVNTSTPDIDITFSDGGSGPYSAELTLNGTSFKTYDAAGLSSSPITETLTSAVEGENTVDFELYDAAGNLYTVPSLIFYVDTTKPTISVTQPTINSPYTGEWLGKNKLAAWSGSITVGD